MIRKMKHYFLNFNLQKKINCIVISVIVVFILVSTITNQLIVSGQYNELLYESMLREIKSYSNDINEAMERLNDISTNLSGNQSLQEKMNRYFSLSSEKIEKYRLYREIGSILATYGANNDYFINSVSILNQQEVVSSNQIEVNQQEKKKMTEIYQQAVEMDGKALWTFRGPNNSAYLSRAVRSIQPFNLKVIGVSIISVDFDKLIQEQIWKSNSNNSVNYYIMHNGQMIYSNSPKLEQAEATIAELQNEQYKVISVGSHSYFAVSQVGSNSELEYVLLLPYDSVQDKIVLARVINLLVMGVCLIVILIGVNRLTFCITRDFNRLIDQMIHFDTEKKPKNLSEFEVERKDEVGQLNYQFALMSEQIHHYIMVSYKNELLMQQATIKALEAQINPHFLYNTLASIQSRAQIMGAEDIAIMVDSLSKLLRLTLKSKDTEYTLGKEIELVGFYMAIQQMRFDEKLIYLQNIEPEVMNIRLSRLILLTFVENAVSYGVEESMEECTVTLACKALGSDVLIQVSNTGSEFEAHFKEHLLSNKIIKHGNGIGLKNVIKRLDIEYGENYRLDFVQENDMATVRLTILNVLRGSESNVENDYN